MYRLPSLYDTQDYLCEVTIQDLLACKEECIFRTKIVTNDKDMYELFSIILSEKNLCFPIETEEATNVYHELRQEVLRVIV